MFSLRPGGFLCERSIMIPLPVALLLFTIAALHAQEPTPTGGDGKLEHYRYAWGDDFDGTTLDRSKWLYRTDSKHWSTQLVKNVRVSDGRLVIDLRKESADGKEYTGGGVISREAFRYGYYEARLKVPPGAGWHTSFWMMWHDGRGGTKPVGAKQELDVIENDSVNPRSYGVNIHKWHDGHTAFGSRSVKLQPSDPSLSDGFHTFGCEFTPTTVTFFFDGRTVESVNVTAAPAKDGGTVPFLHGDQHIWLTSIASPLGGTERVDEAGLPATAEFDYVRFFTRQSKVSVVVARTSASGRRTGSIC